MVERRAPKTQFILALGVSTLVSIGLFAYGAWRNHSTAYEYLIWNLFLAWLPLLFALWLTKTLHTKLWSSWEAMLASGLWLIFLPNSFYMVSDFIHLRDIQTVDVLYDAVMFTSFVFTSLVLGFSSVYLIHKQLSRRFKPRAAGSWIAFTLLLCGFAVYLGRDLRWNSWDILTNPAGLLFDVSDRFLHLNNYPQMLLTALSFFVLLGSMYGLAYRAVHLLKETPDS